MFILPVYIGACIRFSKVNLPERFLEQLRITFTWTNPKPSRGGPPEDAALWSTEKWCALREWPDAFTLPRGLVAQFQSIAKACGVQLEVTAKAVSVEAELVPFERFAIVPRDYQRDVISLLIEKVQGYIVLPCGGGKTTIGALALLRTGQSGIILVHTTDLLDQWVGTLRRALGGDRSRIRLIGGGNGTDLSPLRPGEIAVAMVQVISGHPDATKLLRSAGVLLADEVHHLAADSWYWILERCPARWRWGLTATPDRADGYGFLLGVLLGKKLYELQAKQLIEWGFLNRPTIVPVKSSWKPKAEDYWWIVRCPSCDQTTKTTWEPWNSGALRCALFHTVEGPKGGKKRVKCDVEIPPKSKATKDTLNWSTAVSHLSEDDDRQELLVNLSVAAMDAHRRVLVLVGRKNILAPLVASLREHGHVADAVASGMAGRDDKIAALRKGRINALVATQLADEGLDVPELDCIVSGNPGKDKGRATQRAGRACRPEGLPPVIFDIVDDSAEFTRQWRTRVQAYEEAYGRGCVTSYQPLPWREAVKRLTLGTG